METWKKILLRAAGFGGGFAVVCALIVGTVVWWSSRPTKPKPLSTTAITAKYSGLTAQVRDETMHFGMTYSLRNNTDRDYTLPSTGEFLIINPEDKGLQKVDGASWDSVTTIPPGQTLNMKFDVPFSLSEYNTTQADVVDWNKEKSFIQRRLKEIGGFKFFDYSNRYEIDCPKWPVSEDTP